MAFLDEQEQAAPAELPERPRRPERPPRRRRPFVARRLLGVGVVVLFVIVVVLAFRGCLQAREERGVTNYVQDVSTIMEESEQRGGEFFDVLGGGPGSSSTDFEKQILLVRGASQSLLDRAQGLDVPGPMTEADDAVQLSLRMRRDALDKIAANVSAATAPAEGEDEIQTLTNQMATLYASDVLWSQVARPKIEATLDAEGIAATELPPGNFMPDPDPISTRNTEWLDSAMVISALSLTGESTLDTGIHDTGVIQVAVGATVLSPDVTTSVGTEREVEVQVENQGTVEETGVVVVVTLEGEDPVDETLPAIAPGAIESAHVTLPTVAPGAELTLEILIESLTGESDTLDNEYSYPVTFG